MNAIFRLGAQVTGNRFCQRALGRLSLVLDHLMGVGTGAGAATIGELVALDIMIRSEKSPYAVFDGGQTGVSTFSLSSTGFPVQNITSTALSRVPPLFSLWRNLPPRIRTHG